MTYSRLVLGSIVLTACGTVGGGSAETGGGATGDDQGDHSSTGGGEGEGDGGSTGASTDGGTTAEGGSETGSSGSTGATAGSDSSGSGDSSGSDDGATTGTTGTTGGGSPACAAKGLALVTCGEQAPPNAFEPALEWTYEDRDFDSSTTPLVANLTDDNGDGVIDLCDTPDVVVLAVPSEQNTDTEARILILDGATGQLHNTLPVSAARATPAIADLDEDGVPEIIVGTCNDDNAALCEGELSAYHADGSLVWFGDARPTVAYGGDIAVANVDNAGGPEILVVNELYDDTGKSLREFGSIQPFSVPSLADMDGDGDMELLFGGRADHHDGTNLFDTGQQGSSMVADLDGDGDPELVVTNESGVSVFSHTGQVIVSESRPTTDPDIGLNWRRPGALADFDGDGNLDIAILTSSVAAMFDLDGRYLWSRPMLDQNGIAGASAFDFLGDGVPEAMFGDEAEAAILGENATRLLTVPRRNNTLAEYPVIADVDNDGSAEFIVVSGKEGPQSQGDARQPLVRVVGDASSRWVGARRIWNQHTYHVTNIREDARVPRNELPHWTLHNGYRSQARISPSGELCEQ